jgi:hypothetical protein
MTEDNAHEAHEYSDYRSSSERPQEPPANQQLGHDDGDDPAIMHHLGHDSGDDPVFDTDIVVDPVFPEGDPWVVTLPDPWVVTLPDPPEDIRPVIHPVLPDGNGNGIPGEYGDGPDLDGNGVPDEIGINPDILQPGYPDLDGDGFTDLIF